MSNLQSYNNFEKQYVNLMTKIINNSIDVEYRENRTGINSYSMFGKKLEIDLRDGLYPLLTKRAIYRDVAKTEFIWFMNGETNIERFQKAGVKIWDAWADENGELGTGTYGDSMRNWNNEGQDQLEELIYNIKTNPYSRRHKIQLWNPKYTTTLQLPTCYNSFNFYVSNKGFINMSVDMRSADLFLGIPYDACLFSNILIWICNKTGYNAGKIIINMTDCHIYDNTVDACKEYLEQNLLYSAVYKVVEKNRHSLHGFLEISNYDARCSKRITCKVAV